MNIISNILFDVVVAAGFVSMSWWTFIKRDNNNLYSDELVDFFEMSLVERSIISSFTYLLIILGSLNITLLFGGNFAAEAMTVIASGAVTLATLWLREDINCGLN